MAMVENGKKEVKEKIEIAAEKELESNKKNSRKMRFLGRKGCETYLKNMYNEDARKAIIIRLSMVSWIDGNMGRVSLCPLCNEDEDTTEHVFRCAGVEDMLCR